MGLYRGYQISLLCLGSSGRVTKAFVTKSIYGNYLGQFMYFDFDWLGYSLKVSNTKKG